MTWSSVIIDRWDVIDAVRRTLRSLVVTGGDYSHTLSDQAGTPDALRRVQIGLFTVPPIPVSAGVPFVSIADGGVSVEPGPSTNSRQASAEILVTGWVPAGPGAQERLQAAAALEADLRRAVYANPQLCTADQPNGWVQHVLVRSETVDGKEFAEAGQQHDLAQMGVVEMTLTAVWRDKAGPRVDSAAIATIL